MNKQDQLLVVSKMVSPASTRIFKNYIISTNNKIPEYASEYKKEYLYIRGLNKEFEYFINKLDNINNGLFESNISNRIKYIMKRFLRAQEKGKLKDISEFMLARYDYCFIEEIYISIEYGFKFGDYSDYIEFYDLLEKIYNQIKKEFVFSDYYGEGFCI